jgi:hypothetical protein
MLEDRSSCLRQLTLRPDGKQLLFLLDLQFACPRTQGSLQVPASGQQQIVLTQLETMKLLPVCT